MTTTLNKEEYIKLLSETVPRIIDTEIEHKRLLNEVDKFMDLGENLTDEQAEVLQLLITLIEQYENKVYQMKAITPLDILHELMSVRQLKQKDIVEIFGSKGITSEVINGKRSISKNQAKALGDFFHVSYSLFL
ncbi:MULTISPECIES: type II toxin-antitoxin system HigA family antitoxin [Aphanizomenon]|jgi:HTH-type transcriptional regulator/antitoxin HigA|uniref:Transcriptional regulator n=1 Tax=Aphanizomenon flos-aquae FACHB-1040 TaxID=2692887 RepID=A0ABR8BRE4_APHFL|nr:MULTISPECIES: transcriptional regulator [Aphanizomenon]MBO1071292.1 transcriptional regulator [Dolichospermum sp. DEX189]MBS9384357.1 transcriptional regulator [Dolichospermum sp. BR01]QSV73258.1 MAG: transcriptional regulator [Aphanizomenon flos-aquae KM1D3_PB]KHG40344.1 transcriptional regulator [Aphanizomenon flos-aquae 2012/KM1/D3]MBD2277498.1 transcriptional regulator [Aphanizomenon flos-aquae FACHB-1040]